METRGKVRVGWENIQDYVAPGELLPGAPAEAERSYEIPPIRAVAFKIVARCNIRCTYCYEDNTTPEAPVMPYDVFEQAAWEAAEYAHAWGVTVTPILHGGETLLTALGGIRPEDYLDTVGRIIASINDTYAMTYPNDLAPYGPIHLQTNAMLMNHRIIDGMRRHGMRASVSLDGDEAANAHRIDREGGSTYLRARRGIEMLRDTYPEGFTGIIAVINPDSSGSQSYDVLSELAGSRTIEITLPFLSRDAIPEDQSAYISWIRDFHDRWFDDRVRRGSDAPTVRLFQSIYRLMDGKGSVSAYIGPESDAAVFVGTDGRLRAMDATTKFDPQWIDVPEGENRFAAAADAMLMAGQIGYRHLPRACEGCSVASICAGGHWANRYSAATGYDRNSGFCTTLKKSIGYIATRRTGVRVYESAQNIVSGAANLPEGVVPVRGAPALVGALASSLTPARYGDVSVAAHMQAGAYRLDYANTWADKTAFEQFCDAMIARKETQWARVIDGDPGNGQLFVARLGRQAVGFVYIEYTQGDARLAMWSAPDLEAARRIELLRMLCGQGVVVAGGRVRSIYLLESPDTWKHGVLRQCGFQTVRRGLCVAAEQAVDLMVFRDGR